MGHSARNSKVEERGARNLHKRLMSPPGPFVVTRTGHNERNAKAEETGSSESRKLTESDDAYGQEPDHVPGNSYWGQ